MKYLEMGKDMKMRHSVSSPPAKYGETFFAKKVLHGKTNVLWHIFGAMFYMENNDQIMQGRKLMTKRFQRSSQVYYLKS